jgi:hypothetical protein
MSKTVNHGRFLDMKKHALVLLVVILLTMACGGSQSRYVAPTVQPKAVYIGSQIDKMYTDGRLPNGEVLLVEVLTYRGDRFEGKLMQITDDEILISEGFTTKTAGERRFKEEKVIELPKESVLTVKIW